MYYTLEERNESHESPIFVVSSAIKRLLFPNPTQLVSSLDSPTFFIIEKNSNQFLLQKKEKEENTDIESVTDHEIQRVKTRAKIFRTQFTISRSAERAKGIPVDSQTASLKRKKG